MGLMYMQGHGVLQNYDKAIYYFQKAAKNGDKAVTVSFAKTYFMKAEVSSYQEAAENYKNSYAWFKISQALPDAQSTQKYQNSSFQKTLNTFTTTLGHLFNIQQADILAAEICPTIKGCSV
ncbi:SEL1-like repeat protein [Legionella pneumophila]